jgi:hypothetical protein
MDDLNAAFSQEGTEIVDENTTLDDLKTETETPQDSAPENQKDDTLTEAEAAPESSTEDKQEDEKPNVPFHEDPKIQEYIQRQVDKRIEQESSRIDEKLSQIPQQEEPSDIPVWFGGDEIAWKAFQADQDKLVTQAEERAFQRIKQEEDQQKQRVNEANEWLETNIREIESTGFKVDKNKLLKTAADFELVDTKGRWNYKAAAEILKREEKKTDPTLPERKKLASVTTETDIKEDKPKDYTTPEDLRNKGWYDFNN